MHGLVLWFSLSLVAACGSDISVKESGQAVCNGVLDEEEHTVDGPFDADGDGFFDGNNPGCERTYPSKDLDCDDDDPDVGGPIEWYPDEDGDGLGVMGETVTACDPEPGLSATTDDCDDTDRDVGRPIEWYRDRDEDGYGDDEDTQETCDPPDGYAGSLGDCDDADAEVNPGAEEICFDEVDNDCDEEVDEECDIDFSGSWTSDTYITYSCMGGIVSITFDTLQVIDTSPTISFTSIGSAQPGTMTGTINPDGWATYASAFYPGTCDESYTVNGNFVDENTFEGTFQSSFSGWTCGDCGPMAWTITATR